MDLNVIHTRRAINGTFATYQHIQQGCSQDLDFLGKEGSCALNVALYQDLNHCVQDYQFTSYRHCRKIAGIIRSSLSWAARGKHYGIYTQHMSVQQSPFYSP